MNEKMTFEDLKMKGKEFYENVKEKAIENKEVVIVFAPVLIGGAVEIIKSASRRSTMRENRRLKERMVYDASHRHYYETKRKIKNREWMEFDERKDNGENVGDILRDMGLLKK